MRCEKESIGVGLRDKSLVPLAEKCSTEHHQALVIPRVTASTKSLLTSAVVRLLWWHTKALECLLYALGLSVLANYSLYFPIHCAHRAVFFAVIESFDCIGYVYPAIRFLTVMLCV